MSFNILETFSAVFSGSIVRQISSILDEPEECTRTAIQSAGRAAVAALMQQATRPSGAADLHRAIKDEHTDEGIARKLAAVCATRGGLDVLVQTGEALGRLVLGYRAGAVVNAVSTVGGIKPASALRLLSIVLSTVFGIVRWYVNRNDVSVDGLASLLLDQRRPLESVGLDSRITKAMGCDSLSSLLDALPHDVDSIRTAEPRVRAPTYPRPSLKPSWRSWAIAAGIAALALLFWAGA